MTNLQEAAPRISASMLRRIWLWVPIGAGAAAAVALIVLVLTPLWWSLQRDSQRLQEVEELTSRLAEERTRAKSLVTLEEKVAGQQKSLVRVISGNGDISTFQAKLDQLARANGVQLDLFEPRAAVEASANKDSRGNDSRKPAKPAVDPLEVEGLQSHAIVMAARGSFPRLLAFLRQLEALNVLVVQSDLQLNLESKPATPLAPLGEEPVLLKMALKLYGIKSGENSAKSQAPIGGQSAGNTPANPAGGTGSPPN